MIDFTNWIWLGAVRGYQIDHGQLFSYVLNGRVVGIANPFWAFYGGPMHTAVGALSDILGHNVILAFDILGLAAWSSAYGGMFWIGRICGLSKADSHFPAICVTTSAYWISDLYGRGDWMEFVAISSIPMVIASALAILRSRRFTFWPTGAFCASFFFFTGSHNVTLLWGITVITMAGGLLWLFNRPVRVSPKAVVRLSGLALLVACMNAWYLVPAVLFGPQTQIYHYARVPIAREMAPFDRMSVVFNPLRVVPGQHISQTKALFVQAPVWFLGWVVVAIIFAATRRDSRRVLWSASAIAFVLIVILALTVAGATPDLPAPWAAVLYPFRLSSYTVLLTAALVIVAFIGYRRRADTSVFVHRSLYVLLLVFAAMSCVLAVWQLWVPNTLINPNQKSAGTSLADRNTATARIFSPPKSFAPLEAFIFADSSQVITAVPAGRVLNIAPRRVAGSNASVIVPGGVDPGRAPILTNIFAGPEFIAVGGDFHRDGRSSNGLTVIARKSSVDSPARLTLTEANQGFFWVLAALSVSATCVVLLLVIVLAVHSVRRTFQAHTMTGDKG